MASNLYRLDWDAEKETFIQVFIGSFDTAEEVQKAECAIQGSYMVSINEKNPILEPKPVLIHMLGIGDNNEA